MNNQNINQTISVVIRTMPNREHFLEKCLFILSGQNYQDIEPIIVVQKLHDTDSVEKIQVIIKKWQDFFLKIHCLIHTANHDARAHSLNLGMEYAKGRYLAFLDDDDKLYPQHYQQLIEGLENSQFAWAYSDVIQANYNSDGQLIARLPTFKRDGYSFIQHLKSNFIPIHAFVLDRNRISSEVGKINEELDRNEDYDFLIRLAFRHQPLYIEDFSAEYCFHGQNTNALADKQLSVLDSNRRYSWQLSEMKIHSQKEKQLGWWINEIIQANNVNNSEYNMNSTVSADSSHYVADEAKKKLAKIYSSYTWKIIRFGKKINWSIRGKPKKRDVIPISESLANQELQKIMFSSTWLLFSLLFLLEKNIRRL